MDKKNVMIAGGILAVLLVFIVFFGYNEIRGMIKMVYVSGEENIPKAEGDHVVVLSSSGYDTENSDFRVMNGQLYVSIDYVNEHYASERFFYDPEDGMVIYTSASQIMNCEIGRKNYTMKQPGETGSGLPTFIALANESGEPVDYPEGDSSADSSSEDGEDGSGGEDSQEEDEDRKEATVYMRTEEVATMFGVHFQFAENTKVVTLEESMTRYVLVKESEEPSYLKAYPKKGSALKTLIGKNEGYQVYRELVAGEKLVCYGEEDGYYKVTDLTGVVGYVEKSAVGDIQYEEQKPVQLDTLELPEDKRIQGRLSVIWDYFSPGVGYFDESISEEYQGTKGALNVIAPTWLHFWKDDDGQPSIDNSISKEYIDWAHQQGYKIWVTLENVDNNFDDIGDILFEIISHTDSRQALVQQILQWYREYGFDGLNVDLENIEDRLGPYYVQFMRELSAVLRPAGCTLSTDLGVPTPWSEHYRRDIMAQVCDYICLMAYDEHYSGDTTAGSVASYPWVKAGVQDSLTEGIPADKLVLCMPLYTRFWYLDSNNEVITNDTRTVGMTEAWEEVTQEWGVEPQWDQSVGQYFAEIVYGDGSKCRVWLEDIRSMQQRIDLAAQQELAGVAQWFQGWDTEEVWSAIRTYLRSDS